MMTKTGISNRVSRRLCRSVKGQAMTEFIFVSFVAFIILFVAIQLAALGREASALGQLNYQVTRWATDPKNNNIAGSNSPQCADVANLITGASVAPYSNVIAVASGYMGKIGYGSGHTVCGSPPTGGIGVAMVCTAAGSSTVTDCAAQRPAGTGVKITLTMDTSSVIFLSTSKTSPNFFGIPFPTTLSSTQMMLTQ